MLSVHSSPFFRLSTNCYCSVESLDIKALSFQLYPFFLPAPNHQSTIKMSSYSASTSPIPSNLAGWAARRNGSCHYGEADCGPTTSPMHACCPEGTFCPSATGGPLPNYCCNTAANCSQVIINTGPYCAESDWTCYGRFCCGEGTEVRVTYMFRGACGWAISGGKRAGLQALET